MTHTEDASKLAHEPSITTLPEGVYSRTEGILYRHYRNLAKLERLDAEIAELEEQAAYLRSELGRGITLQVRSGVSRYENLGVAESPDPELETMTLRSEERLERLEIRLADTNAHLVNLKLKEQDLRRQTVPVEAVLNTLTYEDRLIIAKRYDLPQWSFSEIGQLVQWSRSSVHRRVKELIAIVAEALDVRKSMESPFKTGL